MKLSGIEITEPGPALPKKAVVRWICELPTGSRAFALILVIDSDRVDDMQADFALIRALPPARHPEMVNRFRLLAHYSGRELEESSLVPATAPQAQASLF